MDNLQCQIKNHHNKKIITVCMDKDCKEKRLSCLLCQIQSHNTHLNKLIEIDEMDLFLKKEIQKQNKYPESISFGQQQIIQSLERLLVLIKNLQKIIMEKVELLKQQNFKEYIKKTINKQQGIEQWNQFFEDILQYMEVDNCLIKLQLTKDEKLNEIEEKQNRIIQQSENSLQMMISLYQKIENIQIDHLCFKENRKNIDIVIIQKSTIKKTKSSSNAIAFANEGFDPKSQSYAFAFQIQNKAQCVWVGVGNDEGSNVPSYLYSNFHSLGHGQYMIGSQQINTFHHTDKDINYKTKGFHLTVGDKIQIQYDHFTKMLQFRKQSEPSNIIIMPITDMTKTLYPCVYLYGNGTQVQLVEY